MSEHLRHHYVPQCYLKYFGNIKNNSGKRKKKYFLYAINTKNRQPFSISIEDACQIKNFYSLSDETLAHDRSLDALTIECGIFAEKIEYRYSELLQTLYAKKEKALSLNDNAIALSSHEKEELAYYIAIQHLRMPQYRERIMNITRDGYPRLMQVFKHLVANVENDPQIANIELSYKYDEALIHGETGFLNPTFIHPIVTKLNNGTWLFAYSPAKDISTSNNPMVSFSANDGYPSPIFWRSSIFYFPLFPDILLIILPKEYSDFKDCTFAEIQDFAYTSFHNYLTVQSTEIYNYNNNFDKIIAFLNGQTKNEKR